MPPARKKRPAQPNRLRSAAFLLMFIAAALIAVLLMLPARREPPGSRPARPEAPAQTRTESRIPSPAEQPGPADGGVEPQRPAVEPAPNGAGRPEAIARPERPWEGAQIAVVIDDVGYNVDTLQAFLEFPGPITFAVLPGLPYTREAARMIRAAGKELILHLPMEAVNGDNPGPGAIFTSYSDEKIRRLLQEDLDDLEGAVGVNNHMGSRATADPRVMAAVMGYLAATGQFFLDSRTTPATQAAAAARKAGTELVERDVFIDNERDRESIRDALDKGVALALQNGHAVLIGHVHSPEIVDILREVLEQAGRRGVRLTSLSRVVQHMYGAE
jgi:polysaccharide deacetylase 2 family uncharacterized protein YibQ